MITVEDLLQAYAYAYDAWLDPETERNNPIPEYAEFIRRSVSWENAKLRELVRDMYAAMVEDAANCDVTYPEQFDDRIRDLGIEVDDERG